MGVLFDVRSVATPSQLVRHSRHIGRVQRFSEAAAKAVQTIEIQARMKVALESPLHRPAPFIPPPDYSRMWFADLVAFGERWVPTPIVPPKLQIADIQRAVAQLYGVQVRDILSARRTANIVRPRQIAMYLAKTLTPKSLPEIGRRFGGRDHTTVLHAVRKIGNLRATDAVLQRDLDGLSISLGGEI